MNAGLLSTLSQAEFERYLDQLHPLTDTIVIECKRRFKEFIGLEAELEQSKEEIANLEDELEAARHV